MRPADAQRPGAGYAQSGAGVPPRIPPAAYVAAGALAWLLGAAAIVRSTRAVVTAEDSDLTSFFFRSAQIILQGHPWNIYAVRAFGGYPNYNPPLSIFLMAPLLKLAESIGLGGNIGAEISFVSFPFIGFVLLLGYATAVALRQLFPGISEIQRFLAYILIIFSPLTWQTFTIWYHLEQPMMLALLVGAVLAFQARREGLGGVLAGLAVLSRTTAVVPLVAFGVLLVAWGEWRALLRFAGAAAGVALVGFAPFFLFDRRDTVYSLVSWRGSAQIGGNSIWTIFKYDGSQAASPLAYALDHFVRRLDMYAVVALVIVVALLAVRRLRISPYGREAWAVLAIAALAVPMLTKNNWPYYYLEPFVFLLIWEFASMHDRRVAVWRWPVLTFAFLSVAATLSQFIGLQSVGALDRIAVGVIEFATMAAFAVATWYRASAGVVAPAALGAAPLGGPGGSRGNRGGPRGGGQPGKPADRTGWTWPGMMRRNVVPPPEPVHPPEGWRPAGHAHLGPVPAPPEGWQPAGQSWPGRGPVQPPPEGWLRPGQVSGSYAQDPRAPASGWAPDSFVDQPPSQRRQPEWLREDPDQSNSANAPWSRGGPPDGRDPPRFPN
jgi:hypothetical protein